MNAKILNILLWIAVTFWLVMMLNSLTTSEQIEARNLSYSQFLQELSSGAVQEVTIQDETIKGVRSDGSRFETYDPGDPGLVGDLLKHDVVIRAKPPEQPSVFMQLVAAWLPFIVLAGIWIWFMRRSSGGGTGGLFNFGKSRARQHAEGEVRVTLRDVAGVEEAKEEVGELVDFLRNPQKFSNLGGRIPRGVLMVGPPGTGKTLLARAIAGEAKVPFFSISGSDFVEMFVGVGASRVRDLFEQAKKSAPCIIFIDEIDAVGRKRGAGLGGGHDEREQTLNQLLVEMDGFTGSEGVIVIAATNRADVLDPALLRPGRFDRQVVVGLPDLAGRAAILEVHMRKVPIAEDVDARTIARGTPGFSGADLANLVNEAALFAARSGREDVGMDMFEKAKDKIMMGAERRSIVMSESEKKLTAYHEAGHAIVGRLVPEHDPVHKVSIIPRGRALGVTLFLPERDRYSMSKRQLESQISSLFGGRLAEEMIFGPEQVTTGASNDIERATDIARNMVTRFGLSDTMGPLAYAEDEGEVFLGRSVTQQRQVSPETALAIDQAVRDIIDRNYQRTKQILEEQLDKLHTMAEALLTYETIGKDQIDDIMAGRPMRVPDEHGGGRPTTKTDGGSGATQGKGAPGQPPIAIGGV
ncbi:ATP-dependent zinc metalloprotease FtsH [Allochromatium vinosum]|uniref:ATP-dependent zinc metalloprotease FtsH n=1 Tax=Allochromatium vinosum (strain ATCC 17899 / DSM 180 / NBRC 103801 / NCIMB 10441 / D) TaxID=572477 RepID=D3RNT8_ALLVD|nr:ATP-dependent zinc metalloprotease FtsH [Allochromatium vinosum]ADC61448.1 ATP-dependent metalloprotease FtsH [Allochromatium vinosum DSM 180]MBK1654322.1 ATP-dependent metalloprotease [Allochromatium vinosum]